MDTKTTLKYLDAWDSGQPGVSAPTLGEALAALRDLRTKVDMGAAFLGGLNGPTPPFAPNYTKPHPYPGMPVEFLSGKEWVRGKLEFVCAMSDPLGRWSIYRDDGGGRVVVCPCKCRPVVADSTKPLRPSK